jgi:hypothetical protein
MEIDAEKLIVLVQSNESLYNYKLKDYHKKNVSDKIWEKIAEELHATGK